MHVVFYHLLFGFRFHSIGCRVFVSLHCTDVGVFFQSNLREEKSKITLVSLQNFQLFLYL